MKKLILSAAFFALAGFGAANASNVNKTEVVAVQDTLVKTPIKLEELPDAVKATLKTDPYKDWTATAAFSVKDGDKSYYQVDVKNEEKVATLKFGADGKPIE